MLQQKLSTSDTSSHTRISSVVVHALRTPMRILHSHCTGSCNNAEVREPNSLVQVVYEGTWFCPPTRQSDHIKSGMKMDTLHHIISFHP